MTLRLIALVELEMAGYMYQGVSGCFELVDKGLFGKVVVQKGFPRNNAVETFCFILNDSLYLIFDIG